MANVQIGQSLTHAMPRGRDIYAPLESMTAYPFPVLQESSAEGMARNLLQDRGLVFKYLTSFDKRAQSCYFPHVLDQSIKSELECFLVNAEDNAEKHPEMLALILAMMATGLQMGVWDNCGGKWNGEAVKKARLEGDVYSRLDDILEAGNLSDD